MEVEKKYLVKSIPFDLTKFKKKNIIQAYLSLEPEVRIRKSNNKYVLTTKSNGTLVREETEIKISKRTFDELLPNTMTRKIKKTRYLIPIKKELTAELDIYDGDLKGLITVEVEFKSNVLEEAIKQAESFIKPEWFIDDITNDKRFKNKYLAKLV